MKRATFALALSIVFLLTGCSSATTSSSSDELSALSDISTEEVKDVVYEANDKAIAFKDCITSMLAKADAYHSSPKDGKLVTISVTVYDGVWKAAVSDPSAFEKGTQYIIQSSGAEEGTRAGNHRESDNWTELLEIELANKNTDIDNAYACAFIYEGKCKSVYFVNGTTESVPELNDNVGDQADWIDSTFEWSGNYKGTLSDGTIVGTDPMI